MPYGKSNVGTIGRTEDVGDSLKMLPVIPENEKNAHLFSFRFLEIPGVVSGAIFQDTSWEEIKWKWCY